MTPMWKTLPARDALNWASEAVVAALYAWIEDGRVPGAFLQAVICNDFSKAVIYADDVNAKHLADLARWLHQYAPGTCHGSLANFQRWSVSGGYNGLVARAPQKSIEVK